MSARIIDISPALSADTAVWPGDTPLSRRVLCDMAAGDNLTLSTLSATVHLGAHADAPSHYGAGAPTIDERDLSPYLGTCDVIQVDSAQPGTRIGPDQIDLDAVSASRVLLATGTYPDANVFAEDFAALEPAFVHALADRGVRLIGIDTPSVDLFCSKDLPAHGAFLARDVAILEGLVLADVSAGRYELIALPLRLVGFDASPVRAVLRAISG